MFFKKFWRKKSNSDIQSVQDKPIAQDKISLAIQTFWTQVKASEQTFNTLEPISIMENLNNLLIDNQLNVIAELTRGDKKNHKIIFTAEGRIEQFELVIRIVKHAPDLNFFEIEAFRTRVENLDVFSITHHDHSLSLSPADLLIYHHEEYRKISLEIAFGKTIPEEMKQIAQSTAFILLDHALGEYDFSIKIDCVNFLEIPKEATAVPLNEFVTVFDQLWQDKLKHTGIFPLSDKEDRWNVFEISDQNDPDNKRFVQRNETADVLVGDFNYCYALTITADVDSKENLSLVYELEDTINPALRFNKQGIHCQNTFYQGVRTMLWHVQDKQSAIALAQRLADQYRTLSIKIECEFDPGWSQYLSWVEK